METTLPETALPVTPRLADGALDLNAVARALLEGCLNAVMDEQASELAEATGTVRNGYRERRLDTAVGTLVLRVPKLRSGTYFPEDVVERWSRTDTALASVVLDAWVAGASTRRIEAIAADLGVRSLSRSRVSRLCAALDDEVAQLRGRDLSSSRWPYLWLDATYVSCREAGAARSVGLALAVACDDSGHRRVVGLERMDTESYAAWRDFLVSLRRRGLSGVSLVVSDAHEGLARAVREVFVGAAWQRCVAHLERNAAERCRRKGDGAAAVAALQAAFRESDPALVRAGYDRAAELLAARDPRGAELLGDARESALAYLAFPREHARWIRTNNLMERLNREVKRRADSVQVFPSGESMLRLVGAVCAEQDEEWACAKNFIDARTLSPGLAPGGPAPEGPSAEDVASVLLAVGEAFDRKLRAA